MQIEFINITALNKEELLQILDWRNRDFIRTKMFTQSIISEEEHLAYCQRISKDKSSLVFRVSVDNNPCGIVNFTHLDLTDKTGDFGIYIVEQGKGIGRNVGRLAIYYYFEKLKFSELRIQVLSNNKRALLYYENQLYFTNPCIHKNELVINGSAVDVVHYSVSNHYWNEVIKERYMDTICQNSFNVFEK